MNSGRSDASTSTDDVQSRPLCLFYFTHPFGVLSPEPPTLAPPHVARAFLNMEPVAPFTWGSPSDSYTTASSGEPAQAARQLAVARARRCTLELGARRDSLSSSLFSGDAWFGSPASCRGTDYPRRLVPYNKILPPLRLPSPRDSSNVDSSDDFWPKKCINPEKFSLPPIELPVAEVQPMRLSRSRRGRTDEVAESARARRPRRRYGVRKVRPADMRRAIAGLMRRALKGGGGCGGHVSPALRSALRTLRDAWPEPRLLANSRVLSGACVDCVTTEAVSPAAPPAMAERAPVAARASPGMYRRRYSVPETIMRKYRLAQQRSDTDDESAPPSTRSATSAACEAAHRFARRDRELMRKSALLRRLGGRDCRGCCCCAETRSLDASRAELAPASPKRQRLDAADMLRAAMRNSFDRAEESRLDRGLSDSAYRSPRREPDSSFGAPTDVFSDSDGSKPYDGGGPPAARRSSDELKSTTAEETASPGELSPAPRSSDATPPTAPEAHIDGRVSERSVGVDNDQHNVLPYDRPLRIEPPPYEVLEIVVSETLNYDSVSVLDVDGTDRPRPVSKYSHLYNPNNARNINVDEYVSNILIESLNSITDQLECMNASIGAERKLSIVEKEIKVKLQNTGVNTIVHLSPTSNNQIIFGNEELCNGGRDRCNNPSAVASIRDEPPSAESNNNEPRCDCALGGVNRAVLQQIQQLFREEPGELAPGEASSVDAYLDRHEAQLIGGVGAGNYFPDADDKPLVPRFSAFPHTDSMEVNTSSSEDAELGGSDCTSLVDSLDDPNSPRAALLRRRPDAVDVLALLPETDPPRDRGEAFFIKIKGNECECDKENVNVAAHMPEKIRQRLYRRHRKREQRMECARRSRGKSARDAERARRAQHARHAERDCVAILDALLDDVIAKVTRDEFKSLRSKRRPTRMSASKSDENVSRRNWKKDLEPIDDRESYRPAQSHGVPGERRHVRGKLSLRPPAAPADRAAKRIYQKSEIHDGNKCIEILEILEYVNGSQSSPETATSDENQNHSLKTKKSRIPIPINEKLQRVPSNDSQKSNPRRGSLERNGNTRELIADMLAQALGSPLYAEAEPESPPRPAPAPPQPEPPPRRASVPHEARSRSNSLRFKRVFDMIPEERSSLSLESGAEDLNHNRRASAPDVADEPPRPPRAPAHVKSAATSPLAEGAPRCRNQTTMTSPSGKSAATSPLPAGGGPRRWARAGSQDEGLKEKSVSADRGPAAGERARRPAPAARPPRPLPRRSRRIPPPADSTSPPDEADKLVDTSSVPSRDKIGQEGAKGSERRRGSSSDSSESGGSLLCSLAPKWLSPARARRARRAPAAPPPPALPPDAPGGWSVTVAGSCRAALPADVEMRLRFPHERDADVPCQECTCRHCATCACGARARGGGRAPRGELPPGPQPPHLPRNDSSQLTLTMKKEALDSSILASKSTKKSSEQLPEVETYRASRSKLKSSVKTRRGYSLHCWLPENEAAPIRSEGLSVLGCAIVPELKPRVPTMSERDLTRVYTPRHYLRL